MSRDRETMTALLRRGGIPLQPLPTRVDGKSEPCCVARPILLNGIEDVISRPDLADRAGMGRAARAILPQQ
jgi:hypothetical protein